MRVAVVGAGPAGAYATAHLLRCGEGVEIEAFDRLPTPWGLIRSGVAPDHQSTKSVTRTFEWLAGAPGVRFHLGVELGRHVSLGELRALHHAVVLTVGAPGSRLLGVPGEDLRGCLGATAFVAWYNGHPEARDLAPDLSAERAVIVGNGNVALDVARVLTRDPEDLARTDIADHALAALRDSAVREVVVLGRRGPAHAAFTTPELLGLEQLDDVDVIVEPAGVLEHAEAPAPGGPRAYAVAQKLAVLRRLAAREPRGGRRIVLRFNAAPVAIRGQDRAEAVAIARTTLVPADDGRVGIEIGDEVEELPAGLVLRSIGYRGVPVEALPFDEARAVVPNDGGRVTGADGVYVAGWIKRGPTGVIGTNKRCAGETVAALLEDHRDGRLADPVGGADEVAALIAERRPDALDISGWQAIDAHERRAGAEAQRPRVKIVDTDTMLRVAARA